MKKELLLTLLFLFLTFLFCTSSIVVGFTLKMLKPSEYGLFQNSKQDLEITYKEILFFSSVIFVFFLLSVSVKFVKNKRWKYAISALAGLYLFGGFVMVLADVIYYVIFANRLNFSAVQTVMNTNPEEAKSFAKLYFSPGTVSAFLVITGSGVFALWKRKWFIQLFSTGTFFTAGMIFTLFGIIEFSQLSHSKGNGTHNVRYWDIIIGDYNEYGEFNRRLKLEKNSANLSKEYNSFYKQDTLKKTLVLVISESLSKQHMSLYGYQRKTTPRLDTNQSICKFNDCVTNAALTIDAVPWILSTGYLAKRINVISLLNKLGYESTWISNQSAWGKTDGTIVLLSQLCKSSIFLDERADNDEQNSSLHLDENVLQHFDKALSLHQNKPRLIVLHLMGCHFDYEKRYPANKNFFKSDPPAKLAVQSEKALKIVNSYDNAMLYHDSVVNEVLKIFQRRTFNENAALLFLSDHGEELYEYRDHAGHGYPANKVTAEIPFFVLLSENFKKNYPQINSMMKARKNAPYTNSNSFFTLVQLLNINSPDYKEKIRRNGFFSPAYDLNCKRLVMGDDYCQMK